MYYIYFIKSFSNGILYIGMTKNIERRIKAHISTKDWIVDAKDIYYYTCDTKEDAAFHEEYNIALLKPKYNIIYKDKYVSEYFLQKKLIYYGSIKPLPRSKQSSLLDKKIAASKERLSDLVGYSPIIEEIILQLKGLGIEADGLVEEYNQIFLKRRNIHYAREQFFGKNYYDPSKQKRSPYPIFFE